jgi:2-aminoadipate transaminase
MTATEFAYAHRFSDGLPDPSPRWTGFPRYNFVGGHNDPELIPTDALAAAAEAVLKREGSKLAMYNLSHGPLGYPGLRRFVADKLAQHRGIQCTTDDIMITSGSGQAIDLVSRLLVDPGDTILMEDLSYGGAITRHKRLGAKIVGVPVDDEGIEPDALARILGELKSQGITPKYLYTIPTIQNPTGSILPLERRRRILAIMREHGIPIFEDECYADLVWGGAAAPPAFYGLDPTQVIHIGSFSKSLAPALRLGYVVAGWDVLSRLAACKNDGGTGALDQMITAEYFARHFDDHIRRLTGVLAEKLDVMIAALEEEFGTAVEMQKPKGGIFLWLRLPEGVDVRKLVKPAADAGIAFNPGPEWCCTPDRAVSAMRLCFALPSRQEIRDGVRALARVCYEQTGIPAQSANVRRRAEIDAPA